MAPAGAGASPSLTARRFQRAVVQVGVNVKLISPAANEGLAGAPIGSEGGGGQQPIAAAATVLA